MHAGSLYYIDVVVMSGWKKRQFPRTQSKATLTCGEPLNIWFTMGLFVAFSGHGSRNSKAKFKRVWWGPKQTQWIRSSETGRMVNLFNDRH